MNVTLDTTVLAKGLIPPRRRKRDILYEEQYRLHIIAKSIIGKVESKESIMRVPSVAVVEIAAIGARLTGKEEKGIEVSDFVKYHGEIVYDTGLLSEAVRIAARTKISGFDAIFIACAKTTNSILITDDKKMHEAASRVGVSSKLLRELR